MKLSHLFIVISIVCADGLAGFMTYSILPNPAPVHWNFKGEVDRLGPPWELAFVFPAIAAFVAGLVILLPTIKSLAPTLAKFQLTYGRISIAAVAALAMIHGAILLNALGWPMRIETTIPAMSGMLIMILGNWMGKLRRNTVIGIRTPWTLANDNVWERTHRAGGVLMVFYGMAIVLVACTTAAWITTMVVIGGGIALLVWAFAYSWRVYQLNHSRGQFN